MMSAATKAVPQSAEAIYELMQTKAKAARKPNETQAQAFVRFATTTEGTELYERLNAARLI